MLGGSGSNSMLGSQKRRPPSVSPRYIESNPDLKRLLETPYARVIGDSERKNGVCGRSYVVQVATLYVQPKQITCFLETPIKEKREVSPVAHPNGVFDFSFAVTRFGKYCMNITLQGKPIPGSPVMVQVRFNEHHVEDLGLILQNFGKFEERMRTTTLPLSQPTLLEFLKMEELQLQDISENLEEHVKLVKLAWVIGAKERNGGREAEGGRGARRVDAVAEQKYLLQIATVNVAPSDFQIKIIGIRRGSGEKIPVGGAKLKKHKSGIFDLIFMVPFCGDFEVYLSLEGMPLASSPVLIRALCPSSLSSKQEGALLRLKAVQNSVSAVKIPMCWREEDLHLLFCTHAKELEEISDILESDRAKYACVIGGSPRNDGIVGKQFVIQIASPNATPKSFDISVTSPHGEKLSDRVSLSKCGQGIFEASFIPETEGMFTISVEVKGGGPARGTPVSLHVVPENLLSTEQKLGIDGIARIAQELRLANFPEFSSEEDLVLFLHPKDKRIRDISSEISKKTPKSAKLIGDSKAVAIPGNPFTFQIATCNVTPKEIYVHVMDPSGHRHPHPEIRLNDNGVMDVTFEISEVGNYSVMAKLGGEHVEGTPMEVSALILLPPKVAEVNQLLKAEKKIQSRIRHAPAVEVPELFPLLVPRISDIFTAISEICAPKITEARVIGPLKRSDAVVGEPYLLQLSTLNLDPTNIFVQAFDPQMNPIDSSEFDLLLLPNGVVDVRFPPLTEIGDYTVHVTWDGKQIHEVPKIEIKTLNPKNFPEALVLLKKAEEVAAEIRNLPPFEKLDDLETFPSAPEKILLGLNLKLEDFSVPKATQCSESSATPIFGPVGQPTAVAQLQIANVRPSDVSFEVTLDSVPNSGIQINLVPNSIDPSAYDVVFNPTEPGVYKFEKMFIGKNFAPFIPVTVNVQHTEPKIQIAPSSSNETIKFGELSKISIYLDGPGNNSAEKIQAEIKTPKGEVVPVTLHRAADGTFDINFVPPCPGNFLLLLRMPGSPVPITREFEVESRPEILLIPNFSEPTVSVGKTCSVGKFKLDFGDYSSVEAQVTDPSGNFLKASVNPCLDAESTFSVDYEPKSPGRHSVLVFPSGYKNLGKDFTFLAQSVIVTPVCKFI
jgi:hypothetical protein